FAWPRSFGALYERNGVAVALATVLGLVGFMALAVGLGRSLVGGSDTTFFSVFSHGLMVAIFGAAFGFAVLALAIGVFRFWRVQAPGPAGAAPAAESLVNAVTLKYLDGGHGEGCNETSDRFTLIRRRFHHLTFYGFM